MGFSRFKLLITKNRMFEKVKWEVKKLNGKFNLKHSLLYKQNS